MVEFFFNRFLCFFNNSGINFIKYYIIDYFNFLIYVGNFFTFDLFWYLDILSVYFICLTYLFLISGFLLIFFFIINFYNFNYINILFNFYKYIFNIILLFYYFIIFSLLFFFLLILKLNLFQFSFSVIFGSWFQFCIFSVDWEFLYNYYNLFGLIILFSLTYFILKISFNYLFFENGLNFFISFFIFIHFFVLFMSFIILSNNLMVLFLGWEGVGLMSFVLISFWGGGSQAVVSAIKALLVNGFGDVFFLMGLCFSIIFYGSTDFNLLNMDFSFIFLFFYYEKEVFLFFLIIAAMVKSAQFFFHIWLVDAMEGPTPVSALIHAATMVTAGIILLVKLSFFIILEIQFLNFLLIIGSLTSFIGSFIAAFQLDLKGIIAYSTCSQLGYMFLSYGLGLSFLSLIHLITHAIFKAQLFLVVGYIIHDDYDQDLGFKLNLVFFNKLFCGFRFFFLYLSFYISILSLVGFIFFGGYFSKDFIIESCWNLDMNLGIFSFFFSFFGAVFTIIYSLGSIFFLNSFYKSIDSKYKYLNLFFYFYFFDYLYLLNYNFWFFFKKFNYNCSFFNKFFKLILDVCGPYIESYIESYKFHFITVPVVNFKLLFYEGILWSFFGWKSFVDIFVVKLVKKVEKIDPFLENGFVKFSLDVFNILYKIWDIFLKFFGLVFIFVYYYVLFHIYFIISMIINIIAVFSYGCFIGCCYFFIWCYSNFGFFKEKVIKFINYIWFLFILFFLFGSNNGFLVIIFGYLNLFSFVLGLFILKFYEIYFNFIYFDISLGFFNFNSSLISSFFFEFFILMIICSFLFYFICMYRFIIFIYFFIYLYFFFKFFSFLIYNFFEIFFILKNKKFKFFLNNLFINFFYRFIINLIYFISNFLNMFNFISYIYLFNVYYIKLFVFYKNIFSSYYYLFNKFIFEGFGLDKLYGFICLIFFYNFFYFYFYFDKIVLDLFGPFGLTVAFKSFFWSGWNSFGFFILQILCINFLFNFFYF